MAVSKAKPPLIIPRAADMKILFAAVVATNQNFPRLRGPIPLSIIESIKAARIILGHKQQETGHEKAN